MRLGDHRKAARNQHNQENQEPGNAKGILATIYKYGQTWAMEYGSGLFLPFPSFPHFFPSHTSTRIRRRARQVLAGPRKQQSGPFFNRPARLTFPGEFIPMDSSVPKHSTWTSRVVFVLLMLLPPNSRQFAMFPALRIRGPLNNEERIFHGDPQQPRYVRYWTHCACFVQCLLRLLPALDHVMRRPLSHHRQGALADLPLTS